MYYYHNTVNKIVITYILHKIGSKRLTVIEIYTMKKSDFCVNLE